MSRLALIASKIYKLTKSDIVIDVGSGQGHLSRLLAYGHGTEVLCIDSEDQLIDRAK